MMIKPGTIACYGFCLVAGAFLARYELHTDDTGVEVFFILAVTFLLGCFHPRNAWQWALLVGPWAPAADLFQSLFGKERPAVSMSGGLWTVAIAVVVVGLIGSYAGALLRKALSAAMTAS